MRFLQICCSSLDFYGAIGLVKTFLDQTTPISSTEARNILFSSYNRLYREPRNGCSIWIEGTRTPGPSIILGAGIFLSRQHVWINKLANLTPAQARLVANYWPLHGFGGVESLFILLVQSSGPYSNYPRSKQSDMEADVVSMIANRSWSQGTATSGEGSQHRWPGSGTRIWYSSCVRSIAKMLQKSLSQYIERYPPQWWKEFFWT